MLKKAFGWLSGSIGYLLYVGGVVVLLLWLLFPKETVRRFLEDALTRLYPALGWQVGTVAVEMPGVLTLRAIEGFEKGEGKKSAVRIDVLTLQPRIFESLRAVQLQAGYRMAIGKGNVAGLIRMSGGQKGMQVEGTVRDIQLAEVPLLNRQLGRALHGSLSGSFTATVVPALAGKAVLEGRVKVENGRVGLKRPILSHTELPFSQGTVILHGRDETLRLEQGMVESDLFDGSFSGTITMRRDPVSSQLDLIGVMQPKNKFFKGLDNTVAVQAFRMQLKDQALPFRITGDLSNPGIHYEEFAMLFQTLEKELK